ILGSTSTATVVFVHRAEPAGKLVLDQQHAIGTVSQNLLCCLDGGILNAQPALARALRLLALALRHLAVARLVGEIFADQTTVEASDRAHGLTDDRALLGAGRPDQRDPHAGVLVPVAVTLDLDPDAIWNRCRANCQRGHGKA